MSFVFLKHLKQAVRERIVVHRHLLMNILPNLAFIVATYVLLNDEPEEVLPLSKLMRRRLIHRAGALGERRVGVYTVLLLLLLVRRIRLLAGGHSGGLVLLVNP